MVTPFSLVNLGPFPWGAAGRLWRLQHFGVVAAGLAVMGCHQWDMAHATLRTPRDFDGTERCTPGRLSEWEGSHPGGHEVMS